MPIAARALLGVLISALLLAAPAGAATYADPAGDGTDGEPGHDITTVDYGYDPASGTATGTITVAGAATTNALALVLLGTRDGDGRCTTSDAIILAGDLDPANPTPPNTPRWTVYSGGTAGASGNATRADGATTTAFTAANALPGKALNCSTARLVRVSDGAVIDEAVEPAPAAPGPTPTPTATPAPTVAPTPTPAPAAPKAKLRLSVAKLPKTLKPGRTARPTLTVRNAGTATATKVKVAFKRGRGLTVKPGGVTIKALKAGKAVTVKLRLSLSRRARASTPLTLTATGAGGLKRVLKAAVRKPGAKAKPKPKPVKGGLAGSYWWWNEFSSYSPWDLYALRFYDNGFAYYKLPDDEDDTAPAKCTSVTSQPDKDGDYGPGCVRWSLKGTRLTITDPKFKATYSGGKLTVANDGDDPIEADRLVEPKAGSRLKTSLGHLDTQGFCGPGSFCSTSKYFITLEQDGRFGKSAEFLSTGGGGVGDTAPPFVAVGSYPADKRGTYEILPGYRIRLSYDNGTEKVFPFGIVDADRPKYADAGFLLGEFNYYPRADD